MPIWKEQSAPAREPTTVPADPQPVSYAPRPEVAPTPDVARRPAERAMKEAIITEEITIEGKIEGAGHVRIAGRFKGDVHGQGNVTIEPGAVVTGGVRAQTVIIAGQLEGNIDSASRVELLETGVLSGDLNAESLTVAAGSRMRGKVEFGWKDKAAGNGATIGKRTESGSPA
jgi:cytoskeletal protein CcmA (bactofilin family)